MFVLDQSNEYVWPVEFDLATKVGIKRVTFNGHFRRIPLSEANNIYAAVKSDIELVNAVFVGWDDVWLTTDQELPVNAKNREILLDHLQVPASIVKAWLESLQGGVRKN